jgi:hypothetical protein
MSFVDIGPSVYDGTMQQLLPEPARQLGLMGAQIKKDLNITLRWGDALRTDAEQEVIFRARYTSGHKSGVWWNGTYWQKKPGVPVTAAPGRSNHRLGTTVDLFILTVLLAWLRKNAWKYGFSNAEGAASGENWHWGYTLVPTITAGASILTLTTGPAVDQEEDENMPHVFHANTDGDMPGIYAGWNYLPTDAGILRPLSASEWEALKAVYPTIKIIYWDGSTLSTLARSSGLYQFTGDKTKGMLGLTGKIFGRNATKAREGGTNDVHWPRAESPVDVGF